MIKISTSRQRCFAYSLPITRLAISAEEAVLGPAPEKEWTVVPPILQADTPVVAVTTIFLGFPSLPIPRLLASIKDFKTWDFPEPAGPVKKVECPERIDSTTWHCSELRVLRRSGGNVTVMGGGFVRDWRKTDVNAEFIDWFLTVGALGEGAVG